MTSARWLPPLKVPRLLKLKGSLLSLPWPHTENLEPLGLGVSGEDPSEKRSQQRQGQQCQLFMCLWLAMDSMGIV